MGMEQAWQMHVVISDAIAPNEIVIHGTKNSVRYTPDGGVEELSQYQREQIASAIAKAEPER